MIDENTTTIGIDLGTSHCTAAVWDSTRGHPKWMRLATAYPETTSSKQGRIMPSAILFLTRERAKQLHSAIPESNLIDIGFLFPAEDNGEKTTTTTAAAPGALVACVGAHAMNVVEQALSYNNGGDVTAASDNKDSSSSSSSNLPTYEQVSAALVTSSKRLLGRSHVSDDLRSSLSLEVVDAVGSAQNNDTNDEITLKVRPLGYSNIHNDNVLDVTPSQATAILLLAIRQCSDAYLRTNAQKKKLKIPGQGDTRSSDGASSLLACKNAVIGVPAHYGGTQRSMVVQCAKKAGFTGQVVAVITESTAASMAYGLFVNQQSSEKNILVFDCGGGTTDVTIAIMNGTQQQQQLSERQEENQRFRVSVTEGDPTLGGDDMDASLLALALEKVGKSKDGSMNIMQQRRQLLHECRRAKERLCGDVDHGYQQPESSVIVSLLGVKCSLTQEDLERALTPWIDRATKLVERAIERFASEKKLDTDQVCMNEVILVGGGTRVPAVREMLRALFPPPFPSDLCLSVNAMAAVAQGAAIQAAILSGRVPLHEVRSAMMLDTVPHAIGVLLPDSTTFVEIIPRDAPLPASGSAAFGLADPRQPGVSLTAVEKVEDGHYPKLGEFTFLLTRLNDDKLSELGSIRSVEIHMTLRENGEFLVSVFDENDPENAGKKPSCGRRTHKAPPLVFRNTEEESMSFEQLMLLIACIVLFLAYVAARIYFQEDLAIYS